MGTGIFTGLVPIYFLISKNNVMNMISCIIMILASLGVSNIHAQNRFYFNQEPPEMIPEIFLPGFISTEARELNSAFTPDGKEFYYSISTPGKGYRMYYSKQTEKGWTKPQKVPFSGDYSDVDMVITKDGKRMYFGSTRPVNDSKSDFKIWYVDRIGDRWSEPKYFDSPVNNMKRSLYVTISDRGTMYFQGIRDDSFGDRDIYYSEFIDGKYTEPKHLGKVINSEYGEGDVLIAPDESYLIVNIVGRSDSFGDGDLYISFKQTDGTWTDLKNMGSAINSPESDYCPMLSPDGKYFFFTSTRTGNGDIYWVDARIIEELRIRNLTYNNFGKQVWYYMDLKTPGLLPEIFAPGIVSTNANEFNAAFTPDGKQLYFTVTEGEKQQIMMMEYIEGKWGHRKTAPFSGIYRDVDPFISPDGKRLYFSSNRPTDGQKTKEDCDFWYVDKRSNGGWGVVNHLENPSTPKLDDFYYTCTRNGVVYYSVFDDIGKGNIHSLGNNEKSGQLLEFGISTDYNDHDPFIAPDESYLIFSSDRPGGFGSNDLYISFLKDDKSWSAPTNMGKTVNSEKYDYCPILSPDENYLFFLVHVLVMEIFIG